MMLSVNQASPSSFAIFSVWLTFLTMPHACIMVQPSHIHSKQKVGKEKKALLIELVSLKVISLNSQSIASVSVSNWPFLFQRMVGNTTFSWHIVTLK